MFRFTIRDTLLLTSILALALGWALDRSRLAERNQELTTLSNRLADTKAQMVAQRERLEGQIQQIGADDNKAP